MLLVWELFENHCCQQRARKQLLLLKSGGVGCIESRNVSGGKDSMISDPETSEVNGMYMVHGTDPHTFSSSSIGKLPWYRPLCSVGWPPCVHIRILPYKMTSGQNTRAKCQNSGVRNLPFLLSLCSGGELESEICQNLGSIVCTVFSPP